MAGNLLSSVLSLATNLLPSITASAQAPSSSSSNSTNSQKGRARAAEEDLERLMRTLKWIKATLYDAEEREIRDLSVKLWLKELKKVAYDAEDVLSEYRYELTRLQVEARKASQASGSHKRKQMEVLDGTSGTHEYTTSVRSTNGSKCLVGHKSNGRCCHPTEERYGMGGRMLGPMEREIDEFSQTTGRQSVFS